MSKIETEAMIGKYLGYKGGKNKQISSIYMSVKGTWKIDTGDKNRHLLGR